MGKNKSIPDSLLGILEGIKEYLGLKFEYIRVTSLEKLIGVLSSLLLNIFIIAIAFFILLFLSLSFAWWYGERIDNMALAYLLLAGIWLLMALIIYIFRKPLIINPLVSKWFAEIALDEQALEVNNPETEHDEDA